MIRVLHILPALEIGGVEIGIKTSLPALQARFGYRVFSIKGPGSAGVPTLSRSELLRALLRRRSRPQVVVSSLWPAHPLGWALQLLGVRWVPFFHAAGREGRVRNAILAWAARRSRVRLCDSQATAHYFGFSACDTIICPFLFTEDSSEQSDLVARPFEMVVCGRISSEKRPDLVLTFLKTMHARWPGSRSLLLLSADDATYAAFRADAERCGLDARLMQNVPSDDVAKHMRSAQFYLNLSDYEGFSMTTVEAIQAGCVPVVRPVGEIPNYLPRDAGIYIDNPEPVAFEEAIDKCKALAADPTRRGVMLTTARDRLGRYEDYVTAFSRAIHHAVGIV